MSKIIPSTKLHCLSVHKCKTLSCLRRYFYERVLNLQTRRLIWPFWYGGVLHVGWQSLMLGYDETETEKEMAVESRRRAKGAVLTAEDKQEMNLQFAIIRSLVFTGWETRHTNWRPDKVDMAWAEEQVAWPVPGFPDVHFCSTIDGGGTVRGTKSILEFKTAKSVSDEYFGSLEFDAQPCSYVLGHQKSRGNGASKCLYMVFRKPQKKLKTRQTVPDFLAEIERDLVEVTKKRNGPRHYFMSKSIPVGANAVKHALENIVATTEMLSDRYRKLSKSDGILKAKNWPQNTEHCYYYNKPCPFTMICRYGGDVRTFLPGFRQREHLYELEDKELAQ